MCVCVCVCVCVHVQTVDPKFEELEQKLTSLEMFLRQLIRNTTTWQEDIQVHCSMQFIIALNISMLPSLPPPSPSLPLSPSPSPSRKQ